MNVKVGLAGCSVPSRPGQLFLTAVVHVEEGSAFEECTQIRPGDFLYGLSVYVER